ncbi:MAG: IMP dehydrogenase, partial [Microthrixaceae bacterium]
MAETEIGMGKQARRGYALDELRILPSRRTRNAKDVDVSWQVDAYQLDIPVMSAPLDGVTSPAIAIELDRLGGLGVLHAEGLWTRHADPLPVLERLSSLEPGNRATELREAYSAPVDPELIGAR